VASVFLVPFTLSKLVTGIAKIEQVTKNLQPLRSGAPPISAEELAQIYAEWTKWRAEWVQRRKIFNTYVDSAGCSLSGCGDGIAWLVFICSLSSRFWHLAVDALPPQEAKDLEEFLGIERDTPEHIALEQGSFCQQVSNPLKRKRA
jgi:26S proteasome regulatory subunit (ATPase 3-interacting protein)